MMMTFPGSSSICLVEESAAVSRERKSHPENFCMVHIYTSLPVCSAIWTLINYITQEVWRGRRLSVDWGYALRPQSTRRRSKHRYLHQRQIWMLLTIIIVLLYDGNINRNKRTSVLSNKSVMLLYLQYPWQMFSRKEFGSHYATIENPQRLEWDAFDRDTK